jgi:renalase
MDGDRTRVGVVGAGAAAAALCDVLAEAVPAVELTVLEKSGGVCGRAATRRRDGCIYEYGANYVTAADDRVTELLTDDLDDEGLVEVGAPVYTFDADGTVSEGREADGPRHTYEAGITQLAKRLFARTDATVHRRTRVEHLDRDGDSWMLRDGDGDRWGPFDALVVNPPAPQTAELVRTADWDAPARDALADAAGAVQYRSIYAAVLHYPFRLDRPWYALVNVDREHEVGWLAREECKRGHVPDGESLLLVQASPAWSRAHDGADPAVATGELAELTADLLGDNRLADPDWTDHQFWRHALPDEGVDREPVRVAEDHGLYCVGDWVAGEARLHAALASGLTVGDRLAGRL